MLTTALTCGVGLTFAVWLFLRELRFWRARGELDGTLFRYSRRRFIRRSAGCGALAAAMLMIFFGLEVLDFTGHLTAFQLYWATVAVLVLLLLVLPFLDMRETYKHLLGAGGADARMQAELARIERELREKQRGSSNEPRSTEGPSSSGDRA